MGMPKGWNRLDLHDRVERIVFDEAGKMCKPNYAINISSADIGEALDLMKEMAAALEFLRRNDLAKGCIGEGLPAWAILNKFKEWK